MVLPITRMKIQRMATPNAGKYSISLPFLNSWSMKMQSVLYSIDFVYSPFPSLILILLSVDSFAFSMQTKYPQ